MMQQEITELLEGFAIPTAKNKRMEFFNSLERLNLLLVKQHLWKIMNTTKGFCSSRVVGEEHTTTAAVVANTSKGENIKWKAIEQAAIYDYAGRVLITKTFDKVNNAAIDVSKLAKGFYIVRLISRNKQIISTKLIIE